MYAVKHVPGFYAVAYGRLRGNKSIWGFKACPWEDPASEASASARRISHAVSGIHPIGGLHYVWRGNADTEGGDAIVQRSNKGYNLGS